MAQQMPRRELTGGPENLGLLRALANPLRRRILDHLSAHGSVNSASLAKALGESTGTTSYHLRQLAQAGLIEEITERSTGRERWWRPAPQDIRMPSPARMSPEVRDAAEQLNRLHMADDIQLYIRAMAEYAGSEGWTRASRGGWYMTREELDAFFEDYIALLNRHGHTADDAPSGARLIALRFFAAPAEP
ncbi:MAG TPA: helix-turn-helix domain-containing protein [Streptosporangiaceae bacterium]